MTPPDKIFSANKALVLGLAFRILPLKTWEPGFHTTTVLVIGYHIAPEEKGKLG